MQLAIKPCLPGGYRLHADTRSGWQAAAVWWHDNQTQRVRLSPCQRQQVLHRQRRPAGGAWLQTGWQKVCHAGVYLHWRRQRGGPAHGQDGALAQHGPYHWPYKDFKTHKGRPWRPWQTKNEGLPTPGYSDTPTRTGSDTTKQDIGTDGSHSTCGKVVIASPRGAQDDHSIAVEPAFELSSQALERVRDNTQVDARAPQFLRSDVQSIEITTPFLSRLPRGTRRQELVPGGNQCQAGPPDHLNTVHAKRQSHTNTLGCQAVTLA